MTQRKLLSLGLLLLPPVLAACSGPEARLARYLERGEDHFAEQNYDKARIEVSNALQIEPTSVAAKLLAGRIAEKQAKPRDAVAQYQSVVEVDPDNIEARAALGRLYLLGGLPDKARELIGPALEKAPGDPRLLTVRGGLRAAEGDAEGALADAEAAVKGAPNDEVAIALLASQYGRAGRVEDALVALRKGVELRPESVDLRFILGEMLMRADRPDEAEEQLRIIADRNRTVLAYWQNLARFHLMRKNPEGAEKALREAVKHNTGSTEAKSLLVSFLATHKSVDAAQQQMLEFVKAEPKQADLKIALGQFQELVRKPQEAEATYREVIAAQGVEAAGLQARNLLAGLLVQKPDLPAAEQLIKEVLAENPRDNDALVLRAGIALSRNETAAAITDLRSVLRDQPNSLPLMRALARAHLQDNDPVLAEEALRNAVQVNPADVPSRLDLAALLARTNRSRLALPILEKLAMDDANNAAVREALFRAQAAVEDWQGAELSAVALKRMRPDLPTGYVMLGSLREREGKYPQAIAEYESALQQVRDPAQVLPALVQAELRQKQPQRAAARLTKFLEGTPDAPIALQLLGEVRMVQGDFPAAIESFDRAIAADPKIWVPYRGKSLALQSSGKPELSLAVLREGFAASGAPELGYDLASRHDALGQHDEVIKVYEEMHKRLPESLPVANNLAMMLLNLRNDSGSLERAERLGELLARSDAASYLDTRGWIKYRRGRIDEALPLLKEAAEKSPGSGEILYHLGMAQFRSGDRGAARTSLEAALAANKAFAGIEEARATLQTLRSAG